MSQRYDVVVTANETTTDNVLGIVRYDSSSTSDPTSTAWSSATDDGTTTCEDVPMASLLPYLASATADDPDTTTTFAIGLYRGKNGVGL
ncbi:hypothetical protein HMPREF1624_08165 [Sporothrix schenckii ATCC 58251]|uniref:Uncharacterized protein n=1 Tax=Sporothrix schenckii (strain ATCC 58251 / de Perez 2211183) TaxID=1391915 RepID=U7PIB8_SPOS1|nr:hypothetical protein HMPREF1624_08165 [Sporothrix schenckii ATCC 58251]